MPQQQNNSDQMTINESKKNWNFLIIPAIVIFIVLILGTTAFFAYRQYQGKVVEDIVREYLTTTQNFDGLDVQIEVIKRKISYSDGFFKEALEVTLFVKEETLSFGNLTIATAEELKKEDISDDFNKSLDEEIATIKEYSTNTHQKISGIKVKALKVTSSSAEVQASYIIDTEDFKGEVQKDAETIFILSYIDKSWKIVDSRKEEGLSSEIVDITKMRKEFVASSKEQKRIFYSTGIGSALIWDEIDSGKAEVNFEVDDDYKEVFEPFKEFITKREYERILSITGGDKEEIENWGASVIMGEAQKTENPDLCERMVDQDFKDACYVGLVDIIGDISLCKKIVGEEWLSKSISCGGCDESLIREKINQIRSLAEIYYSDDNSYTGLTFHPEIESALKELTSVYGLQIDPLGHRYLAYAKFCSKDVFICADSSLALKEVTGGGFPKNTYLCP